MICCSLSYLFWLQLPNTSLCIRLIPYLRLFSKGRRSRVECWMPERDILEILGNTSLLIWRIFLLFLRIQALDSYICWVQTLALALTCANLGTLIDIPKSQFLSCKLGMIAPFSWGCCEGEQIIYAKLSAWHRVCSLMLAVINLSIFDYRQG